MYKSLQACRAIAALLVVLYHLGGTLAASKYFNLPVIAKPFSFGNSGVAFFFVLSGFIIVFVHRKDFFKPAKFSNYFWKRVIRIYPSYWIIFGAIYLCALASPDLRPTVTHDPVIILKSILLLPQDPHVVGGTGAPVIAVAWSLQYEIFFYALIGLIILGRIPGVIIAVGLLVNFLLSGNSSFFLQSFFSSNLLLLFAFGAATAFLCMSRIKLAHPLLIAFSGALTFLIVGLAEILPPHSSTLIINPLIAYGLASSVMIFGFVRFEDCGRKILHQGWIQLLGGASYVLYLIHYPLISVLVKFCRLLGLKGITGALFTYIAILIACVICAVIFHVLFERPLLDFLTKSIRRMPHRQNVPQKANGL